jgi:hypothetical protein
MLLLLILKPSRYLRENFNIHPTVIDTVMAELGLNRADTY